MIREPVATIYAKALLLLGEEQGQSDRFAGELEVVAEGILSQRDLRVFFESPKIPREEKKRVIEKTLGDQVSPAVLNLLRVLVDRGRQMLLGEIAESYDESYDELKGRVHVRVATAAPISEGSWNRLLQALRGQLKGKEVVAERSVDSELLGGVTIRMGDKVVDGSLRTELNKIRGALASQRLGSELVHED